LLARGSSVPSTPDDPGISAIDLRHEYEFCRAGRRINPRQIHQAQINALETAFLSEEEQRRLREEAANRGGALAAVSFFQQGSVDPARLQRQYFSQLLGYVKQSLGFRPLVGECSTPNRAWRSV